MRTDIDAGLDHGPDAAAIRKILVQTALYTGFSAADETLPILADSLDQRHIAFTLIHPRTRRSKNSPVAETN